MFLVRIGDVKTAREGVSLKGDTTDDFLGDIRVMGRYFVWPNGVGIFNEAHCDHEAVFVKHLRVHFDARAFELLYVGESLCVLVDIQFMVKEIRKFQLLFVCPWCCSGGWGSCIELKGAH